MAGDTERWQPARCLTPLFQRLDRWVDEWITRQHSKAQADFDASLVVVERFDGLLRKVGWLEDPLRDDFGIDRWEFQAAVALSGLLVAARPVGGEEPSDPAPPATVARGFLSLRSPSTRCREDVTAAQLATAYLAGRWAPPGCLAFTAVRWEPAALAISAMTHKSVRHGLHVLANKGVPPLHSERCERREHFDRRVAAATHTIAVWLTSPDSTDGEPTISEWDCEVRSLWEFLSDAILGPGRAGSRGDGDRPQPGAFSKCLLGRWCESRVGVLVKDVELFLCPHCREPHGQPTCPAQPTAVLTATWCRRRFVTPRSRLPEPDREWGHEEAVRKICKNPDCAEALHRLLSACGRTPCQQEPLYPVDLTDCPYCGCRTPGQRGKTVWTRHP